MWISAKKKIESKKLFILCTKALEKFKKIQNRNISHGGTNLKHV